MRTTIAFICISLSIAVGPGITVPTFAADDIAMPVDEAAKNQNFLNFRNRILDAIALRDTDAVVAMASRNIKLDFGGGEGREEFRKRLTLSSSDLSEEYAHRADEMREEYWNNLEGTLRLGGRFVDAKTFQAPYLWTLKLSDEDDLFVTSFIIERDVPVRDRPSKWGKTIATLSYNKVEVLDYGRGTDFVKIKLPESGSGYVHEDSLRSQIDYRAFFVENDGNWELDLFLAGD